MSTATPEFSTERVHSNERIEIDPPPPGWWMNGREATHAEKLEDLQNIKAQIERHVDNAGQGMAIVWDTTICCAHCKEPVESGTYGSGEPACCNEAIAEWVASGGVIEE